MTVGHHQAHPGRLHPNYALRLQNRTEQSLTRADNWAGTPTRPWGTAVSVTGGSQAVTTGGKELGLEYVTIADSR